MEFKKRRELKRTKIEVIPMIDTMFFLLVFFMLTSLSLAKINGLPVNLPQASHATKQAASDLTITIDAHQQIFVNKEPVTTQILGAKLIEKAGGPQVNMATANVILNADGAVPHGLVIQCMDISRGVGITRFAFATSQ